MMNLCYITFRSVTYAQRGEKLLSSAQIRCALQRTPRWMEEQGCGYCLRLQERDVRRAVELLRKQGINLRKVYVQQEDGTMRELVL